jgi:hypothetical protein
MHVNPPADAPRPLLSRNPRAGRLGTAGLVLVLWGLALTLRPTVLSMPRYSLSDSGVFYAAFHRLAQGERLYAEVFDHKDPLFYLFYTACYALLGAIGPMVWETALTLGALALAVVIVRQAGLGLPQQALVALAFFALFLHPSSYFPIHTNHQALTLALGAVALGLARRDTLAGVLLGAMALTKLTLLLYVPALALLILAFAEPPLARRSLGRLGRMAAGSLLVAALVAVALLVGGSFGGYLDVLGVNLRYQAEYDEIRARYWPYTPPGPLQAILANLSPALVGLHLLLLGGGAMRVVWPERGGAGGSSRQRALLLVLAAAASVAATGYILASGYAWLHYYQILCIPALLTALCTLAPNRGALSNPWLGAGALALYVAVAIFSGALRLAPSHGGEREAQRDAESYEETLRPCVVEQFETMGARSFATLGSNDSVQVAFIAPPGSRLACRAFYQFPWFRGAILDGLMSCIDAERPDLVFQRQWHFPLDIGDDVDALLRAEYRRHASCGGVTVWRRR